MSCPRFCLLVALLTACPATKEKDPAATAKIAIYKIEAADRTESAMKIPGINDEILLKRAIKQLTRAPVFELISKRSKGSYYLRLEVGLALRREYGKEERVVLVSARAENPEDPESIRLHHSRMMPLQEGMDPGKALLRAADDSLAEIIFQGQLVVAPPAALIKALSEKAPHRLAVAVEMIAQRKIKSAGPRLVQLLQHEDETVSDPAIGALVAIGYQEAVHALTRLSKFNDMERMAKLLDAIGALGGAEAKEYLQFVASGHEDADIKNMAAEALERLSRQKTQRKQH